MGMRRRILRNQWVRDGREQSYRDWLCKCGLARREYLKSRMRFVMLSEDELRDRRGRVANAPSERCRDLVAG